ncbi:hypothetical protein [Methyloprofundus sp.]|uniref:hypothetical protein n=1 Tax=Methyloprofundus sp. TaxID=2020875 RepID=UPI003D12FAFE
MTSNINSELIQFTSRPAWFKFRGKAMIFVGSLVALLSVLSPDVYIMGESASWIPVISIVVLIVGVFRCIDALAADTAQGFLYNIHGGVLDIVVGFLVVLSTDGEANNLNLLIVGYMLTQGIYRNILLSVAKISNPLSNRITGIISIILGIMIWIDWPTSMWFIAFSLSVDISFRGWALVVLSSSINK